MKTFVATKLMCITDGKRNCHLSEIRGSEDSLETLEASFSTFAMYGSIATHSLICWAAHHRSCQRPWMSWNSSQPTSLILTGKSGSASLSTARAKATSHCNLSSRGRGLRLEFQRARLEFQRARLEFQRPRLEFQRARFEFQGARLEFQTAAT